jgi:hypothetical protein
MKKLTKILSFFRWRLVPVRYAMMLGSLKWNKLFQPPPSRWASTAEIEAKGFIKGPDVPPDLLRQAMDIYGSRGQQVVPSANGHPFVNLFNSADIHTDNPIFRFAFSSEVLDVAADYFGGCLILDSIQVLYSYPTEGPLRESQYWHLDYGDRKSFHCVAYLRDVFTADDGPFVFVDKPTSYKVGRSMIVRRIPDQQFERKLKDGKIETFYGKAGSSVQIDPSVCYHYGSRCKTPRLAIFVTFSTWFPFAQPAPIITQNAQQILVAARQLRPDLSKAFLQQLLQLG